MKPLCKFVFSSLLLAFLSHPANAQTKTFSEINSYSTEIDRFIKVNKKHRIFGDVANENSENAKWKEFKTQKVFDDAGCYQSAFVYSRNSKVVAANFMFTSPSGDWAHYINYYYRDDGSLAKISARLNTFEGNVSVLRDRYYDVSGKLLHSTVRYLDLQTHKSIKKADFQDMPIPMYRKVSALPFSKLL